MKMKTILLGSVNALHLNISVPILQILMNLNTNLSIYMMGLKSTMAIFMSDEARASV